MKPSTPQCTVRPGGRLTTIRHSRVYRGCRESVLFLLSFLLDLLGRTLFYSTPYSKPYSLAQPEGFTCFHKRMDHIPSGLAHWARMHRHPNVTSTKSPTGSSFSASS